MAAPVLMKDDGVLDEPIEFKDEATLVIPLASLEVHGKCVVLLLWPSVNTVLCRSSNSLGSVTTPTRQRNSVMTTVWNYV